MSSLKGPSIRRRGSDVHRVAMMPEESHGVNVAWRLRTGMKQQLLILDQPSLELKLKSESG